MTLRVKMVESFGVTDRGEKLNAFVELFAKWNKSINLSAARTIPEIDFHIEDSLHIVPLLRSLSETQSSSGNALRVVDVGSGGGLPVVVAAICLPSVSFTAIEPVHKKHAFLRTAARELSISNLEPFAQRIEEHPDRDYDVASSRATFDLDAWLTLALTLVVPGGTVVGFEAVERTDLSVPVERRSYSVDGKGRSLVVAKKPAP
ncbi:MAG TPA: 16S rRNA (guanine(527)-N(7))-methyltransferase RsmG [Kofleriaceae bacterium]|jgi:16S rRNA (guanine527-N7)-methyltransferase